MIIFIIVIYAVLLIASIILPISINKMQALMPNDILSYFGCLLTFIGTTSLGLLTIYLNIKKETADKKAYLLSIKPYINVYFEGGSHTGDTYLLMKFRFCNASVNPALNFIVEKYKLYNNVGEQYYDNPCNKMLRTCFGAGEFLIYEINDIKQFTTNSIIEIFVAFEDKLKNVERLSFKMKNIGGELKNLP